MNHDIHPGKLKRKTKRGLYSSVVDLPAADHVSSSGNLLGDSFFESETSSSDSFTDLYTEVKSDPVKKNNSENTPTESRVELSAPISPLDLLKSDEE